MSQITEVEEVIEDNISSANTSSGDLDKNRNIVNDRIKEWWLAYGSESSIFFWIAGVFLLAYHLPIEKERFTNAVYESLALTKWYAQEHVLLCLIPAFFVAGVIAVFVSQGAVIKYFGARAKKWKAYLMASVSGCVLSVCSCTILPLFSSIHKRGAGLGPAIAFLYSGPAINILAIILTASVLGFEMGLARTIGAIVFCIIIGIFMHLIFLKEERKKAEDQLNFPDVQEERPLWKTSFHFLSLVAILVFANWGAPASSEGILFLIYSYKWWITSFFGLMLTFSMIYILGVKAKYVLAVAASTLITWVIWQNTLLTFIVASALFTLLVFTANNETREWGFSTWGFAKQIMPLLAIGVVIAGLLLGTAEGEGLIPNAWVAGLVGGNSLFSNFFASIFGAFMYFATLTEIPILQGLMGAGMGKGPALALLLAGPSLSLPNMLVIRQVLGNKKTAIYIVLVVIMATSSGLIYGSL